jgi:hypothetical protein
MFKIGQKVVCKNTDTFVTGAPYGIEKGKIYTVIDIYQCACGRTVLELDEAPAMQRWCCYTNKDVGFNAGYYAYRFEPLKYDLISNKDIIKNSIFEKSDLPVKEPVLN